MITLRVGSLTCHTIVAGRLRLDGGAMFGVVPKPLWERKIPADERNRILLCMRCLVIEHPDGLILVDTGLGNKESDKVRDIYAVDNIGRDGATHLEDGLAGLGFAPAQVRYVINTHLHFDHAGGNTRHDEAGNLTLSFPEAEYLVQRGELDFALHPNERTAGSYFPANLEPVSQAGRWRLLDGPTVVAPGVRTILTPGHVPHHQSVLVEDGGETLCFLADLVPTTAHIPLPWIMGYDLEPLVTLEEKRKLLGRAAAEGWTLVFEHDAERGIGRVVREGKSYGFQAAPEAARG